MRGLTLVLTQAGITRVPFGKSSHVLCFFKLVKNYGVIYTYTRCSLLIIRRNWNPGGVEGGTDGGRGRT